MSVKLNISHIHFIEAFYVGGIFSAWCCARQGVRQSASHKRTDRLEIWAIMTAQDYYITARHEIDPLYTNKSERRLSLKWF